MTANVSSIGRWCTVIGLVASIGAAYLVMQFASIMDYVQALFGFFIIPLFGTVIIGMLWKRATPAGGFWGLFAGTSSSILLLAAGETPPGSAGDPRLVSERKAHGREPVPVHLVVAGVRSRDDCGQPVDQAQSGLANWKGLVYGCRPLPSEQALPLYRRPIFGAAIVAAVFLCLNLLFW